MCRGRCAQEVSMADEEAFFVVVGVDEPAGDAFGAVAADFAGVGVEDIHAVDLDANLPGFCFENVDVGFAENDEEVTLARCSRGRRPCASRRSCAP
ncbi:MAG: hypothetical protein IPP36_08640 [Nitrosomonadales bacterium]|nr:hypothetical protein [Nitrosomonadales bacterium]